MHLDKGEADDRVEVAQSGMRFLDDTISAQHTPRAYQPQPLRNESLRNDRLRAAPSETRARAGATEPRERELGPSIEADWARQTSKPIGVGGSVLKCGRGWCGA